MLNSYSIATGNFDSTQAAADILDQGGNAYDAILAALFMSFVCEPLLSSPGGGGYLLAQPQDKEAQILDFFAQTPHKLPTSDIDFLPIQGDFGDTQQQFHIGMAAAATPGMAAGIFAIHQHYGSIPLITIARAAIEKAQTGMQVSHLHANVIQILSPIIKHNAYACEIFSNTDKQLLSFAETKANGELAEFLYNLASKPANWFYHDTPAQTIIADMHNCGGLLSQADFASYQVAMRKPLTDTINNWTISTNAAPTTGGFLLLEQLKHAHNNPNPKPAEKLIAAMVHADKLKYRHDFQSSKGTSHMSIIDPQGNIASLTVSNGEGCGYVVPNCGFMLNNFLGEEDINTGGFFNYTENTRMASMMSPTILQQDQHKIALGSGGSNRIKTAMFQVIWQLLAESKTLEQAINQPRFHYENGVLDCEYGISQKVIKQLQHSYPNINQWQQRSLYFGGVNAAATGTYQLAIADARRHGVGLVKAF